MWCQGWFALNTVHSKYCRSKDQVPQVLTEGGMCGRLNRVLTCPSYVSVPGGTLFYILSSKFGNKASMITMVKRGLEGGMTLIHSFILILWEYSWGTILYQFQLYYIVIWHFHTSWNGHHGKSSKHIPLYVYTMPSLSIHLLMDT